MNIYLCVLLSISSWFFSVRVSTIADPLVLRAMDDSVSVLARAMCPANLCRSFVSFLVWVHPLVIHYRVSLCVSRSTIPLELLLVLFLLCLL